MKGLKDHFLAATRQDPCPYGDDAVEWDYSRYARALGLTGMPGLRECEHGGAALVVGPPTRWAETVRRYGKWAASAGWSPLVVSARPSVVVPDPVIYALGDRIAGHDSLIFARCGAGSPAIGKRPRSAGMSVPLEPGERWLIAADRVRRRVRAEAAQRGLVLIVEDAHEITASAMNVLGYLLNTHRAWQARMLSADASLYVVFLTTEDHAPGLRELLRRHGVKQPALSRLDSCDDAPQLYLDAEAEHLVAALAAAPLLPTERDIGRIFGASAVERVVELGDRRILIRRIEAHQRVYSVDPACREDLPEPPARVLEALLECYRRRIGRAYEHPRHAAADLEFRLGRPGRALAYLAANPHSNNAVVPYSLFHRLDERLGEHESRLHADHLAAWFSMHAHFRGYDRARELTSAMGTRDIRSARECVRLLHHVLCTGRTHLDECLPEDFWPSLRSSSLDPSLLDCICILADLFVRLRLMSPDEIRNRFVTAEECHARCARASGSTPFETALAGLASVLRIRAAVYVPTRLEPDRSLATVPGMDVHFLASGRAPAYVTSTVTYAVIQVPHCTRELDLDLVSRPDLVELVRATGNPLDSRIQLGGCFHSLHWRGAQLLLRGLADELVVLFPESAPERLRSRFCSVIQMMAGNRTWLVSASKVLARNYREPTDPEGLPLNACNLCQVMMFSGDFAGARDALRTALGGRFQSPYPLAVVIQTQVTLARRTLAWNEMGVARALMERWRGMLSGNLERSLERYIEGSVDLCAGHFQHAIVSFRTAREALATLGGGTEVGSLRLASSRAESMTRKTHELVGRTSRDDSTLLDLVAELASTKRPLFPNEEGVLSVLDYVTVLLEHWACQECRAHSDEAVTATLVLRQSANAALGGIGDSLVAALARNAPSFYSLLRQAISERIGYVLAGVPSVRTVNSALDLLSQVWRPDRDGQSGRRASVAGQGLTTIAVGTHSDRCQAKKLAKRWPEDATLYSVARSMSGPHPRHVRVFGYVGSSSDLARAMGFTITVLQGPSVTRVAIREAAQPATVPTKRRRTESLHGAADVFIGESQGAREVRKLMAVASRCDYPVLIVGETGVGKELVAKGIHRASARAAKPLIVADCAARAENLLESELFGHRKGAFTGASASHAGLIACADGATLFLDEVDSMSQKMQAALLRVLETKEYRPVGADEYRASDFRVLSAALPGLREAIEAGEFRSDLYYRLSTLIIEVPPLRRRPEDAVMLARHFAGQVECILTSGALREIEAYSWPGNVRQLKHCIEVATLVATEARIGQAAIAGALDAHEARDVAPKQVRRCALPADLALTRAAVHLRSKESFNVVDFSAAAGVSRRSAQRHLAGLLRLGRVVRLGAGPATRYRMAGEAHNAL